MREADHAAGEEAGAREGDAGCVRWLRASFVAFLLRFLSLFDYICSDLFSYRVSYTAPCFRYNQEDETGNIIKSMKREIHKMVRFRAWRLALVLPVMRVHHVLCTAQGCVLSAAAGVTSSQELRHVALLQEQEDLVVEVERCISKRESISMKVRLDARLALVFVTLDLCIALVFVTLDLCVAGQNNAEEN